MTFKSHISVFVNEDIFRSYSERKCEIEFDPVTTTSVYHIKSLLTVLNIYLIVA